MPPTPESLARENIDAQLAACGWTVQDRARMNLYAGRGVAVREFPLTTGFADYLLFVDRKAVGVIEAKAEGVTLSGVAEQAGMYSIGLPANIPHVTLPLPFLYESTGVETYFRDERDPQPRSRRVFTFHKPETLANPNVRPPSSSATISGHPPATNNSTSSSISSKCSKSTAALRSSCPITSCSKVARAKPSAATCSRNATCTPCCACRPASSTPRASKPTSCSSIAAPGAKLLRQKNCGFTTCAPTRTSP